MTSRGPFQPKAFYDSMIFLVVSLSRIFQLLKLA